MADRLLFAKEGRARYISHLDLMRTFQRAFARAKIPIKHTEGFHPHPFVSIALPLSVGYGSRCEILEFGLLEGTGREEVPDRLNAALPEGITVRECYPAARPIKELAFVDYEAVFDYPDGLIPRAEEALRAILSRESVLVRKKSKKSKTGWTEVDIIPRIKSWQLSRRPGALVLEGVLAAQEPGLNPELIRAALCAECPDLAPDFASFCRREILDGEGKVFR